MANNLMSGSLSYIVKEQVEKAISKGDTALASAYKTKKFDDCVQALFQGFQKLAKSNCAMSGDDALIGSAAIHWYTDDATIDSIADILKSGTEVLKIGNKPTTTTTSAKPTIKAESKPKTTKPKAESKPQPKAPVLTPMTVVKAPVLPPTEEEDIDWFD